MLKRFSKTLISTLLSATIILSTGVVSTAPVNAVTDTTVTLELPQIEPSSMRTKAKGALVVDAKTGEIILSKNAFEKLYPASITKLMTGLILAERRKPTDILTYTENAKKQEPYSINTNLFILQPGDEMTVEDAMEALMMLSANDVAVMIAENISKTQEEFVQIMNEKAQEFGMTNTHFQNPVGLHHEENYSTAYDISILLKKAMQNEFMRKVMAQPKAEINTKWQKIGEIENKNILVGTGGNLGGKTGFTEEAGRTLTCYYSRKINDEDKDLIVTLLGVGDNINDPSIFKEMEFNANEAYRTKKVTLVSSDDKAGSFPVEYKLFRWFGPVKKTLVPFTIKNPVEMYPTAENIKNAKVTANTLETFNPFKLKKDQEIGVMKLTGDGYESSQPIYSTTSTAELIIVNNIIWYVGAAIIFFIIGTIIVVLVIKSIRKKKSVQKRIRKNRHNQRRRNIRNSRFGDEF